MKTHAGQDLHVNLHPYCCARRLCELRGHISAYLKKKQRQEGREAHTELETPAPTRPKRPWSDSMAENEGKDEGARPQKRPRADIPIPEHDPTPIQPPTPGPANNLPRADMLHDGAK
ncbi:hypothetical protein FS749_003766 [Ceratobasidium sp. UAMH 11750]|nr:hypothetical protein FS749_003766 [Ceratobasidium sp. UAMH 11750]